MTVELAALLFAAIALWAAWRANSIAHKALEQSSRVRLLELQAELLREIDLQHAKFGSLLAATAEALVLYIQHPELAASDPTGHARAKQNVAAVESLRKRYEEQRALAESMIGQSSIESHTIQLADTRRLTIHVQEDIDKELRNVEFLREQLRTLRSAA